MDIDRAIGEIEGDLRGMPLRRHVAGDSHGRPRHISEIANRLEDLRREQARIQRDLGRPWAGPTARCPTLGHRAGWRIRAKDRLACVLRETAELKAAIKQIRAHVGAMSARIRDPEDPYEVLNAAYAVIRSVARRTGRLEPEEQAVADAVQSYLQFHVPPSLDIPGVGPGEGG